MLAALKQQTNQKSDIIMFPFTNDNNLLEYLKHYDIEQQDFNYERTLTPSDIDTLRRYHDDKYSYYARQTVDNEIVYYSFDHLEQIKKLLSKYETNKSKSR